MGFCDFAVILGRYSLSWGDLTCRFIPCGFICISLAVLMTVWEMELKAGYLKVGVTRSGKDILVSFIDEVKAQVDLMVEEFSAGEIFDAYAIFEYLSLLEYRRSQESDKSMTFSWLSEDLKNFLTNRRMYDHLLAIRELVTSIDIVNYGKSLVLPHLRSALR